MDYIKKKRLTEVGKAVGCLETHLCMLIVSLMKEKFYQKLSGAQIAALSVALIEDNRVNTERFKIANLRLRDGLDLMMQQTKEIFKVMKKHKFEVSEVNYYISRNSNCKILNNNIFSLCLIGVRVSSCKKFAARITFMKEHFQTSFIN